MLGAQTYSSKLESPLGPIHLIATDRGLAALYFDPQREAMDRRFPPEKRLAGRENVWLRRAEAFLSRYFAGDPSDLPGMEFDLDGTPFQQRVWRALRAISAGQTRSYGEIAASLGRPEAARAVGAAVGQNPVSLLIPCHRVVGGGGKLTGYAGGLERKRFLLEHEARNQALKATA